MTRALSFGFVVVVAAFAAGPGVSVGDDDPPPAPTSLLAISDGEYRPPRLVHLDARTLQRLPGRTLRLGNSAGGWTFSPDGARLAVGGMWADGIRIVDVPRMRLVGAIKPSASAPASFSAFPLAWLEPRLLLALELYGRRPGVLLTIDQLARRVVARHPLDGSVSTWASSRGHLVLLVTELEGIRPARLIVAGADGVVRALALERVHAGSLLESEEPHWMRGVHPALAVDPHGERAVVVSADRPLVAEIDLATLSVTYRELREPASLLGRFRNWLEPAAEAKLVSGPTREARWLGNGLIAVSGYDHHALINDRGEPRMSIVPAGLQLIDTRTWTISTIDSRPMWVVATDGAVLAFSGTWDPVTEEGRGMGMAVFGLDGSRRFQLFGDEAVWGVQVAGRYAYVREPNSVPARVRVVDLGSGRLLHVARARLPSILRANP